MHTNLIELFEIAEKYFAEFVAKYPALKGRQGVYLLISQGKHLVGGIVGHLTDENIPLKRGFAAEKLNRLQFRRNNDFPERSSFPSHNPAEGKYGGCIFDYDTYISTSGLPPEYDHLFGVEVLQKAGRISQKDATAIIMEIPAELREPIMATA